MAVFAEGQEMATGHIPKDSLTVSNSRSWVASNAKHKAHVNSSKQTEDIMLLNQIVTFCCSGKQCSIKVNHTFSRAVEADSKQGIIYDHCIILHFT